MSRFSKSVYKSVVKSPVLFLFSTFVLRRKGVHVIIIFLSNDPCHIWQLMCSRDNSKSLSAAHDMLFIGAGLGSKG